MLIFVVLLVSSLLLMPLGKARSASPQCPDTATPFIEQRQLNSEWQAAVVKGLTIGRSTREEMVRAFGAPKWSESFNEENVDWIHYDGGGEVPGELVFIVDQKTGVIRTLTLSPTKLTRTDAIKHFGDNYKVSRYQFCKGFEEEDSAPIYESPTGGLVYLEYRTKGIALAIRYNDEVEYIAYVSDPIGSKCKR